MATAADDRFESLERVLADFVEGAMEGNLHGCCQLDDVAGARFVDAAIGGEEAHNDRRYTEGTALFYIMADALIVLVRIVETSIAGSDENMGAETREL